MARNRKTIRAGKPRYTYLISIFPKIQVTNPTTIKITANIKAFELRNWRKPGALTTPQPALWKTLNSRVHLSEFLVKDNLSYLTAPVSDSLHTTLKETDQRACKLQKVLSELSEESFGTRLMPFILPLRFLRNSIELKLLSPDVSLVARLS